MTLSWVSCIMPLLYFSQFLIKCAYGLNRNIKVGDLFPDLYFPAWIIFIKLLDNGKILTTTALIIGQKRPLLNSVCVLPWCSSLLYIMNGI